MSRITELGTINLGYPVFASSFTESEVLVAGGGGEGKNGIKNKITLLSTNAKIIRPLVEYELPIDEDNPTSLDVTEDGMVYAGVNRSSKLMKAGVNDHLRVFDLSSKRVRRKANKEKDNNGEDDQEETWEISSNGAYAVFENGCAVGDYQKITRVNEDAQLLAVVSSSKPGKVAIIGLKYLTVQLELVPEDQEEINDVSFEDSGRYFAVCTRKHVYLYDLTASDGEVVGQLESPSKSVYFSRINLYRDARGSRDSRESSSDLDIASEPLKLATVLNTVSRKGFNVSGYSITEQTIEDASTSTANDHTEKLRRSPRKRTKPKDLFDFEDPNIATGPETLRRSPKVPTKSDKKLLVSSSPDFVRVITKKGSCVACAFGSKYSVFASSDFSVYICTATANQSGLLKKIEQAHTFAVTSVAMSGEEDRLVTTSVDNTVKIYLLPRDNRFLSYGMPQTLVWAVIAALLVLVIAVILEKVIQRQLISELIKGEAASEVPLLNDVAGSVVETVSQTAPGVFPVDMSGTITESIRNLVTGLGTDTITDHEYSEERVVA